MKYKDYSSQVWDQINQTIEQAVKEQKKPVAAFDADGTLWDTDLGENFFQYQIDRKLVDLPADPWQHYQDMKKINNDPRQAYLWLAQICRGQQIQTIREWAAQAVKTLNPLPIFEAQQKLVEKLHQAGVDVYVVTASIKWAVEPGAALLGIPQEKVIGVQTKIENGIVTEHQDGIITYRPGKVEALLQHTQGQYPFFASGNSTGDDNLLASATHLALAVSAAAREDALFKSEDELQKKATAHGWLQHRFV